MRSVVILCGWIVASTLGVAADPIVVKFGTLGATVPSEWKSEKPANRLRSHQFKLPSGEEGVADAEIIISPERSPKPDKEFPAWKAQYTPPDGKTIDDVAKTSTLTVSQATIHRLDVSGTWKYKEFPQSKKEEVKEGSRTIWAIVVVGDEATHVRFSGPEAVVAKHAAAVETWLKSMK
jgi:hypothetical protein